GRSVDRRRCIEAADLEPLHFVVRAKGLGLYAGLIVQSLIELASALILDVLALQYKAGIGCEEIQTLQIVHAADDGDGGEGLDGCAGGGLDRCGGSGLDWCGSGGLGRRGRGGLGGCWSGSLNGGGRGCRRRGGLCVCAAGYRT